MRTVGVTLCLLFGIAACGPHGGGQDAGEDAGPPGPGDELDGGTLSSLTFAVVGDTRPMDEDVVGEYPTTVIQQIYADIQASNPRPNFVVTTGDYMYSSTTADQQLGLYLTASAQYTGGVIYPVMGNHECDGFTADNCTSAFVTSNLREFQAKMLAPIGATLPYYAVNFAASDSSWTAKLVVIACNRWDSTQKSWLQQELARSTTYTFIARHEPLGDTGNPPCENDSDPIVKAASANLVITGHSHYFSYIGFEKEIIVGNGGAPLSGSSSYFGYTMVQQQSGGFLVTSYDQATGAAVQSFTVPF